MQRNRVSSAVRAITAAAALIAGVYCPVTSSARVQSVEAGGSTQPDVALRLVDAPNPAGAGKLLTYRITIENRGTATASNVTVSTSVPAGTAFDSLKAPKGWQVSNPAPGSSGSVTAFLASVPTGPRFNFELTVEVSQDAVDGSTIDNVASVAISETDSDPANNSQSTSTRIVNRPPSNANLRVNLEAGPSPAAVNGQIVYTIGVDNLGPQAATDVVVAFNTPPGTTFSQVFASYGRCEFPPDGEAGQVRCTVEAVTPRRPLFVAIVVNVVAEAGSNIPARVLAGTTSNDSDTSNNVAMATTPVTALGPSADLAVEITGAPDPVIAGQVVEYVVTVRNDGPAPSRDTTAFFRLPGGGRFREATTDRGQLRTPPVGTPGPVAWRLGFVMPGVSASMTVSVLAFENGGTPFNAGALVVGDAADPNFDNNSAASIARCRSAGRAIIQWDPPDPDSSGEMPAPTNLVVSPTNVTSAGKTEGTAGKTRAGGGDVLAYNVYVSSSPNTQPTDENLFVTVGANETTTSAPTAPGGSFFTVTATYPDGDSDSADSAGTGDKPGATITKVKVKNGKLTLKGSGFTDEVEILFDGIPYAEAAIVKKQNSKAVQSGLLATGQTIEQYLATGTSFVIIVRNDDGGVTLVEYVP
ncbi:MAG: DUF11 domain-containing protein [Acidobacteria bacterium]|nr:DUF11 domain-containing protein [Acidobacteriota bacterium]